MNPEPTPPQTVDNRTILARLNEIEDALKELKVTVHDHYDGRFQVIENKIGI